MIATVVGPTDLREAKVVAPYIDRFEEKIGEEIDHVITTDSIGVDRIVTDLAKIVKVDFETIPCDLSNPVSIREKDRRLFAGVDAALLIMSGNDKKSINALKEAKRKKIPYLIVNLDENWKFLSYGGTYDTQSRQLNLQF